MFTSRFSSRCLAPLLALVLMVACGGQSAPVASAQSEPPLAEPSEPPRDDPTTCLDPAPPLLSSDSAVQQGSGLSKRVIQRTISANYARFGGCYEQALDRDAELAGRMGIGFSIELDGSVGYASLSSNTLPDCQFTQCVLEEFRGVVFPKPDGKTVAAVTPLNFATE